MICWSENPMKICVVDILESIVHALRCPLGSGQLECRPVCLEFTDSQLYSAPPSSVPVPLVSDGFQNGRVQKLSLTVVRPDSDSGACEQKRHRT
jgi:hypothetical protein